MEGPDALPVLFGTSAQWAEWLDRNHATCTGIWLKIARLNSGVSSVSYADALEGAICYGWIDGQKRPCDADFWLQRFTPRKARSKWSKINREKAESLTARRLMKPSGLAEIERAKRDGRWAAAYDGQRAATVPDDLRRALETNPEALDFFQTLDSANRYAILYRIQDANKPETRVRRIERYVGMLERHEKLH